MLDCRLFDHAPGPPGHIVHVAAKGSCPSTEVQPPQATVLFGSAQDSRRANEEGTAR